MEYANQQGQFIEEPGKIDRRHGDPDAGGLSSGEKASITRAKKFGDELHFLSKLM